VLETGEHAFVTGPDDAGQRLDRFLSRQTGLSLRAARRLAEAGSVRVDAHPRPAGYKLCAGRTVTIAITPSVRSTEDVLSSLVAATADYAAFFKPAGLNTAALAGVSGPSLEALLPRLCPERSVILLNRLDRDTSGLVLGAFAAAAAARFRALESQGLVDKRYLAVVIGEMPAPMTLKWALDTAHRAKVKVLGMRTPDALRWTVARPLAYACGSTLVEARIAKGARHQIRAHLAHAGFPISGDALYGADHAGTGLKLHHRQVTFPGFRAGIRPNWHDVAIFSEYVTDETL